MIVCFKIHVEAVVASSCCACGGGGRGQTGEDEDAEERLINSKRHIPLNRLEEHEPAVGLQIHVSIL